MRKWFNTKIIASLPIFISVNIAVILVWYFNISQQTMPLILGIIGGGLVDLDNRFSGRIKSIFYILIAFFISSFSVQLTIEHSVLFILAIISITFCFTMLSAISSRYKTVSFGTLAVALYTIMAYVPEKQWYINPTMVLIGALLYSVVALLVYSLFPYRSAQENVANVFYALANYLDAKASFFDPDGIDFFEQKQIDAATTNSKLIDAFNQSRISLLYRLRSRNRQGRSTSRLSHYYFTAQEIHDKMTSNLFDYQALNLQLKNTDLIFRIQRLIELQAQSCRDIGRALYENKKFYYPKRLDNAMLGLNQSFELFIQNNKDVETILRLRTLIVNLQRVDWQLSHLDRQHQNNIKQKFSNFQNSSSHSNYLRQCISTILSQFTLKSPIFRHAIRLSIVVLICCLIVEIFNLDKGYWILLTAVFVCQPNYSETKKKLKQRIIGTFLGVIVGSAIPFLSTTLEVKLGLIVIATTLFFFFRKNNYSFSTFFITLQVLISFDIMGLDIHGAMLSRLLYTLIGSAVAWCAVSYIWPDWKFSQLLTVSRQALKNNINYFSYIITLMQFGRINKHKLLLARREANEEVSALNTIISNMNSEQKKYSSYIEDGFQLFKINYSLLSYITALDEYCNEQELKQGAYYSLQFCLVTKKLLALMQQIELLSKNNFDKELLNVEFAFKQFITPNLGHEQIDAYYNIPIQQLSLIIQILPRLHETLQHQLKLENVSANVEVMYSSKSQHS